MAKKAQETPTPAPTKKTVCPVSREQFLKDAKPMTVTINSVPMAASAKEFSTGSLGWNINEKTAVMIGDVLCKVQVGLNITVVGSKELPK